MEHSLLRCLPLILSKLIALHVQPRVSIVCQYSGPSGNNIPVLAPAAPPLSQGFGGDTVAMLLII
jgi:hypothetical protein